MTAAATLLRRPAGPPVGRPPRLRSWRPEVAVLVVALAARLAVIFRGAGLHGSFGYDPPVYFAAADALIHGRLPYHDFVLLHPPGVMLALAPFAALTHLVSDSTAFAAANLAFLAIGGVNAVLVVRIARRLGFGRGAVLGGLCYAVWFGAVGAEFLARLEPLGNLCFLAGLLLLVPDTAGALRSRRALYLGGAALGAAISVKIWWSVPVVLVLAWCLLRDRRAGRAALFGTVLGAVLIDAPFFAVAPRAMWSSVITDQLGRNRAADTPLSRLEAMTTVQQALPNASQGIQAAAAGAVGLVAVLIGWRACATRRGRGLTALFAVQVVVLLAAPSFFLAYRDYAAGAAALTVAAAASRPPRWDRLAAGALVVALAASTSSVIWRNGYPVPPWAGASRLTRAVASARCVMSDSPMALIELDALSRDLANGCPNWVDVTGRTYGIDHAGVSRSRNAKWQRDLVRYLRSGQALIIERPRGDGLTRHSRRALERDGVLARSGGHVVYRSAGR